MAAQLTSPTALRQLVLNYLVHHCYIDTAQAFVSDGIETGNGSTTGNISADHAVAESAAPHLSSKQAAQSSWRSNASASGNGHTRSSSRLAANQHAQTSAHPLSAPPLLHEDSSMELEVDGLLTVVGGPASSSSAGTNGHRQDSSKKTEKLSSDVAADAHAARSGLSNDELSTLDLQRVRIRREIREHIVAGRIRQAVDLCNKHFPSVLTSTGDLSNGDKEGHTTMQSVADRNVNPSSIKATDQNGKETVPTNERILPANPTSLKPAHLSLNLQIQAFIECVRAAASTSTSTSSVSPSMMASAVSPINPFQSASAMPSMHTVVSNAPGIAAAAISRSASPAPSSTSSTGSITSANGMSNSATSGSSTAVNPVLHAALRHAQTLYSEVQSLPPYWRSMYLKELESVTTMLAYTDLERSPVRKYLDQSRRVALAEQINSAIMFRTGKPSQPLIESAVRQTTFCWSTLAHDRVPIAADHAIFSSGAIVGLDRFDSAEAGGLSTALATSTTTSTSTAAHNKNRGKILPAWDLHSFLRER
jgi:hypothetical protein